MLAVMKRRPLGGRLFVVLTILVNGNIFELVEVLHLGKIYA